MEHPPTVLAVDDEPLERETLRILLDSLNCRLAFASGGVEALRLAAELIPDLILLDVMMPGMDGFEVCRRLRADPLLAQVPIILVTALDDRDSRLRGAEAGADDFISKPYDRMAFRARVRTILRLNRYRRLLEERTQRQQAEEETRRRNLELALLNHVITTAASTLDVRRVLQVGCEVLLHFFALSQSVAVLLDESSGRLEVVAECLLPPARQSRLGQTTPLDGDPVYGDLACHRHALVAIDAQSDPRLAHCDATLRQHGVVSVFILPVLIRDQLAGYIELDALARHTFSDQDVALAQGVATAIGQAMETGLLYQKLQRHADSLEETVARRTRELQAERDRTQAILEALGEAVIVTDVDGQIQYVNPATMALTGYSAQEMVGQTWKLWQSGGPSSDVQAGMLEVVRAGQMWRGDTLNRRKDGALYDAAVTVAPLFEPHESGRPVGFVGVQRDVTPLREAERLKDQFVSNVSHELRTPLSVITLISGNLDVLYDRLDEARRRKMIRDIREHTRLLNDLIDDVLEISRIDGRRVSLDRVRLDLADLAQEEVDKQLPLARSRSQTLTMMADESVSVLGNAGQLRQVIRNLVNNAIKYTPDGGQITCECRTARGGLAESLWPGCGGLPVGSWAAVRVADTGVGIAPQDLARVFERFYRVEAQGSIPGTGLGLSIARELVELHGGHITAASSPDQGSIFVVYLPLVEET